MKRAATTPGLPPVSFGERRMKVAVGNTDVDVRVEAIFSMPRLGFTANHQAWTAAFLGLGIRPTFGTGAFWDQVLTRTCEKWIDEC